MAGQYATKYRTHTAGELRELELETPVTLCGWYPGPIEGLEGQFDLTDRYGRVRIFLAHGGLQDLIYSFSPGDVLQVQGTVSRVPDGGDEPVEVTAGSIVRISRSDRLPIHLYPEDPTRPTPTEFRQRYRYLDLRRPVMQQRLEFRSRMFSEVRNHMMSQGFLELDTPVLGRWTMDATTAFIVAKSKDGVFAMSQSPQFYKQMLMIGGCDRYFQLARCFRNEQVLTPDRQPEFTSLDMEMSYVDQEDVLTSIDSLMAHLWGAMIGVDLVTPIPRMTYDEAMLRYGTDRPDLRYGLEMQDITELGNQSRTAAFRLAVQAPAKPGGAVRALCIPADALPDFTDDEIDALLKANADPRKVTVSWLRLEGPGRATGPLAEAFDARAIDDLISRFSAWPGDVLMVFHGRNHHAVSAVGGRMRSYLGRVLSLIDTSIHTLIWVTHYPYWAYDLAGDCFLAARHPFTRPLDEHVKYLERVGPLREGMSRDDPNWTRGAPMDLWVIRLPDPGREDLLKIRTQSYELVLDGEELGSGSVRIHDVAMQEKILSMFGYDRDTVIDRFHFIMEALRYGAPPHGGIAIGIERLLGRLQGLDDISEVMAFPKNSAGACLVTGAPSAIDPEFLEGMLGQ